jgi:hypothetical protein
MTITIIIYILGFYLDGINKCIYVIYNNPKVSGMPVKTSLYACFASLKNNFFTFKFKIWNLSTYLYTYIVFSFGLTSKFEFS